MNNDQRFKRFKPFKLFKPSFSGFIGSNGSSGYFIDDPNPMTLASVLNYKENAIV